jgi:hypothetical protein
LRVVGREEYMGEETRRGKVLALAEAESGQHGADLLWDGVCRKFLMGEEAEVKKPRKTTGNACDFGPKRACTRE